MPKPLRFCCVIRGVFFMARIYKVVDAGGSFLYRATKEEIKRYVRLGQAVQTSDARVYQLLQTGKAHLCRTRISSGGVRAAMGMSQDYVARDKGQSRFKTIYPEDQPAFTTRALFTDDPYEDKGSLRLAYG
jgi:hypothetical protein